MPNNFLENFTNYINNNLPFLNESKLLIAVSGGIDSVVLVYLCKQLNLDISLAHCNFNLRGLESEKDEAFVNNLGEELGLEVFVQNFDTETYAKQHKLSIQMAARELRYQWFEALQCQLDFDYILTAHHADDNLETFLINLSRGTGLEGLSGIPVINDALVRPLLAFTRDDIEAYAVLNKIEWREDASNASIKYLRNKIRHEVIPILKGINPQLLQNFNKTISHLNESLDIINDRMNKVSDEIISVQEDALQFNISKIKTLNNPRAYLYELLKDYGFTEWDDVFDLLEAQSGKQLFSEGWRLVKHRDSLLLSQIVISKNQNIFISSFDNPIQIATGVLYFEEVENISTLHKDSIYVDKNLLKFPLIVRPKKDGDSFFPFGMKGSKKLSKFLKDEKLSLIDKEKIELLCSCEEIVWVICNRADNRFRVTDKTKTILKICLK
jgi:tRNA(Ile)-lysidine synthase